MKNLPAALCLAALPLAAATLTDQEREAAIGRLRTSGAKLVSAVEGVSGEQWKFKPAPDRWSIAECVEHVVASDRMLFLFATQKLMAMPAPANPEKRSDEAVVAAGANRDRKVKTMEFLEPKGRFASKQEALEALRKGRETIADYLKSTTDDLRAHGVKSFGAYSDAYQFLLTIAAHAERHTAQIEEVKAAAGYPK